VINLGVISRFTIEFHADSSTIIQIERSRSRTFRVTY
jgi:hypothetical protein